jgi:hypothetical protein
MRTKRHVQPQSHCQEEETWLLEQNQDEEGTEAVDAEGEERTLELESLRGRLEREREHACGTAPCRVCAVRFSDFDSCIYTVRRTHQSKFIDMYHQSRRNKQHQEAAS